MSNPEQPAQPDPRLEDPDKYFGEKYGEVEILYRNGRTMKLGAGLEAERLIRGADAMDNLPPETKRKRAIECIKMLREAGALDPTDDINYQEEN